MVAVALDAMGGAHAPLAAVQAAAAISLQSEIECVLVGDAARLATLLEATAYDAERIAIVHAPEAIGSDEEPRSAVRYKRKASLLVALRQVVSGRCAAVVSAAASGAALAAAARELAPLAGVRQVAMAGVYPRAVEYAGQDPLGLALDVGATVRCTADELVQFAAMGAAYARVISRVAEPRVALLNMGREATQGDAALVAAHRRLRDRRGLHFVGNVEGHELTSGRADVVVCEGLLGNVAMKLLEAVASVAVDLSSAGATPRTWRQRAGLAMLAAGQERLRALADLASYGGAPLLGFEQIFIRAHARSEAPALVNAVKVAAKAARDGLVPALVAALAEE